MLLGDLTMQTNNLILIGFMACGKSSVGRVLSNMLGFEFIDLDALIVQEQKMSIKDIFRLKGESFFRKLEYESLKRFVGTNNKIISCGGGTPTYFSSYSLLKNLGKIFFIDTPLSLILERVKRNNHRPLGDTNIHELYYYRLNIYKSLGLPIQTSTKSIAEIANTIAEVFLAKASIKKIYIERNIIFNIKDILVANNLHNLRPVIITNSNLLTILDEKIKIIENNLNNCLKIAVPDGEEHKTYKTINYIYEELFKHKFTRQTLIIALGGGVIGDMAGFVAATYLRGVPFIQVPTTMLSFVDSSIGGKTGIDTDYGKNLIGAFYSPSLVLIDESFLESLPQKELACGMAEVIKHAIIADKHFFNDLLHKNLSYEEIITKSLDIKKIFVQEDFSEQHIRAYLNLGHTFAHAIESCSNYKIKHGEAVSMGLVLATKLSKYLGLLEEDFLVDLLTLLNKYNLPINFPDYISIDNLILAMHHDKKADNNGLKFILPINLGKVIITYVALEQLRYFLISTK